MLVVQKGINIMSGAKDENFSRAFGVVAEEEGETGGRMREVVFSAVAMVEAAAEAEGKDLMEVGVEEQLEFVNKVLKGGTGMAEDLLEGGRKRKDERRAKELLSKKAS